MNLREAEKKLLELNNQIAELPKEREAVLKKWNKAFNCENQDKIICVDESIYDIHNLYLVNGDSKIHVCHLCDDDMEGSINDLYKRIDISMHLLSQANGRGFEIPEYQRNLVLAKVSEIRDSLKNTDM